MSKPAGKHRCSATVCLNKAPDTAALCDDHLAMLTDDTRAFLGRVFKPGKKQSKRFFAALRLANDEIRFFPQAGHRVPREQPLPLTGTFEEPEAL